MAQETLALALFVPAETAGIKEPQMVEPLPLMNPTNAVEATLYEQMQRFLIERGLWDDFAEFAGFNVTEADQQWAAEQPVK